MTESNTNLGACLLIYDIHQHSVVPYPSRRLRTVAVRVNLSCWVIREGDVPYALLHEMALGGATWHVVRFDAGEGPKLVGMAVEAIKRDIRDAMRRANRSAADAGRKLDHSAENRNRPAKPVLATVVRSVHSPRRMHRCRDAVPIPPASDCGGRDWAGGRPAA